MENSIDFQKQCAERLISSIKTANEGVTHADFAAGVKNRTMGFKVMFGEPNKLLYGPRKKMFNIFVMLYMVAPVVLIPILAYHADNWWLLFGIAFSYLFTFFATWGNNKQSGKWMSNLIYYFFIYFVVNWIRNGFHFYDYATFFFFCSLWGTFFFKVADQVQFDYALQMLTENEQLFNMAVGKNQIMIIHKDAEDKRRSEEVNQDKASKLLDIADTKFEKGDYNAAISDYTKSIELYPFVSAFENRGFAKMELKDYNGAIDDLTNAIDRMPSTPNKLKFANIYRQRAEAHKILGLTKEADFDLEQAKRLSNN